MPKLNNVPINFRFNTTSVSTDYTINEDDHFIEVDATSGDVTLTLPPVTAGIVAGQPLTIKKIDSSANLVILDGDGSETIDGATTHTLYAEDETVSIISNATEWVVRHKTEHVIKGPTASETLLTLQTTDDNATNTILEVENSSGTVLVSIENDGILNTASGRIKNTTRVTTTYTILVTDDVVFANTDSAGYTVTLPVGVEGQTVKIINSGSSVNNLTLAPDGSEHLMGANSNFTLADGESLILTYNATDGWY